MAVHSQPCRALVGWNAPKLGMNECPPFNYFSVPWIHCALHFTSPELHYISRSPAILRAGTNAPGATLVEQEEGGDVWL